jgi:ADP-ribose pyrophosphatase YjhB (NUDIX family)
VVLLRGAEVLLIRRGRAPSLGEWSLPGGAQHLGETAEACARRELFEETGLEAGALELLGHADAIHRDEQGRVLFHYTILDFWGHWRGGEPQAGSDAAEARFVSPGALDHYDLRPAVRAMIERAFAPGPPRRGEPNRPALIPNTLLS